MPASGRRQARSLRLGLDLERKPGREFHSICLAFHGAVRLVGYPDWEKDLRRSEKEGEINVCRTFWAGGGSEVKAADRAPVGADAQHAIGGRVLCSALPAEN